ncbi:hypothetical protein IFM89_006037 [Coptis chinensis]|uniref:DUF4283 domain-containing protein n=1 Tax=Coptis chinensis TaxID=261450 RepID=A0A835LUM6_9MAGN|nr:hypothetical protein IFM89_006037 [Coptis chinensis]
MVGSKGKTTINQDQSNNIENLSADFTQKVHLPYKSTTTIVYSGRMKAKLLEHNKLSIFIRILDGKIVAGNLRVGLEKLWAPFKIVKMEFYKNEIFKVWLENQHQLELILKRQPWIVSQHILQIEPWTDMKESKELDFIKFFIWFKRQEISQGKAVDIDENYAQVQTEVVESYNREREQRRKTPLNIIMEDRENSMSSNGGMRLVWERFVNVEVLGSESWFIHYNVELNINGKDEKFVLSCVYGNPKLAVRKMQ